MELGGGDMKMNKDTSRTVMIISTLVMLCLIFGLTLAYAEPKRITSAEQQDAVAQKKQRKQDIKAQIPDYATIEQQIDAANGLAELKVVLKKLAKVAVLQSGGE